ncbi:MAG: ASCH domain-containing protein [Calditrichaeota bacterium]|nr:ASCH domain-containing protein [Calditrichota bacterium]
MEELPLFKSSYRIVKFCEEDKPKDTDFKNLKSLIEESDDLYPGIDIWFKKKVKRTLQTGERFAILVYHDEQPIGSAILRKGKQAKLCSMRIDSSHQFNGLGSLMLALLTIEVRHKADSIHFTIPEDLWLQYSTFFQNYGFNNQGLAGRQYRKYSEELACSASYMDVMRRVIQTSRRVLREFDFTGESHMPDLLLSVRPRHAEKIISGEKTVEIRKGFPTRWGGAKVMLYVTKPSQEIVGEAIINDVEIGTPSSIWEKYNKSIGCDYSFFREYCGNHLKVSAIKLSEVREYKDKMPLNQLQILLGRGLRPPQSYQIVRNSSDWDTAIALGKIIRSSSHYSIQH